VAFQRTQLKFRHQHRYRNELNTAKQLKYFTNIHLLIPRFITILKNIHVFITIKLNTLTYVPNQMTVGGAFVYVCENLLKGSH